MTNNAFSFNILKLLHWKCKKHLKDLTIVLFLVFVFGVGVIIATGIHRGVTHFRKSIVYLLANYLCLFNLIEPEVTCFLKWLILLHQLLLLLLFFCWTEILLKQNKVQRKLDLTKSNSDAKVSKPRSLKCCIKRIKLMQVWVQA